MNDSTAMQERALVDHRSKTKSVLGSIQMISGERLPASMLDVRQESCTQFSFLDERDERHANESETVVGSHTRQDFSFPGEERLQSFQGNSNPSEQSLQSPRHYFIKKGRERLDRTRGALAEHNRAGANTKDLQYPLSLSQDDDSYRDDLRRSVLEEEWEMDQPVERYHNTRHQPRWKEVQDALLSAFESADPGDNTLRKVTVGVSPGNDSGMDQTLHGSIQYESTATAVSTGRLPNSTHKELSGSRLGSVSCLKSIPKIRISPIMELGSLDIHSNARSEQSLLQLTSEEEATTSGRISPLLDEKELSTKKRDLPSLQQTAPRKLFSARRREELDLTGGSSPVVCNKRKPFCLPLPPKSKALTEPKQVQTKTKRNTHNSEEKKRRTQERLQYLKKWLKEREVNSQTPTAHVFPVNADPAEKKISTGFAETMPVAVSKLQPNHSFHSAPSLDEGEGQITQIQEKNLDNSVASAKYRVTEGSSVESTTEENQCSTKLSVCESTNSRTGVDMKIDGKRIEERTTAVGSDTSFIASDKSRTDTVPSVKHPHQNNDPGNVDVDVEERESRDDSSSALRSLACPDSISDRSPKGDHGMSLSSSREKSVLPHKNRLVRQRGRVSSGEYVKKYPVDERSEKLTEKKALSHPSAIGLGTDESKRKSGEESKDMENQEKTIRVSSSLTDSLPDSPEDTLPDHTLTPKEPMNPLDSHRITLTPRLRKSSRAFITPDGEDSIDLSVSYTDANSFESKDAVKVSDLPYWRMDPLESLSDFIIQIRNKESGETRTYHVHKHILACGPRRSKHLDTIFQSSNLSSAHFVLDNKATDLFPCILDFIYCHDHELQLTTENAVVYRSIGEKFQINSLIFNTTRFIQEDMQVSNMTAYVTEIEAHNDHKLRNLVQAKCAENIEQISELDTLWILMDPELFWGTISCPLIDREKTSPYLSILVKEYTSLHMHEMSEETFRNLTSPSVLPTIDRTAALPLLEICFSYGSPKAFEPLQERCACTMASYWKITSENDRQRLFALLRNLPSAFTVDFLEKVESGKVTSLVKTSSHALREDDSSGDKAFTLGSIYGDVGEGDGNALGRTESISNSWKMDPVSSYSDWSIRVKHAKHGTIDVYNVHKHVMAVGQYKSIFFSDMFLSSDSKILTKGTTTVALDHTAAELFPQMLDFMYSRGHTLTISTETAVALRFLARAFKVWTLNKRIVDFVQDDLSMSNVLQYIDDADSFNDEVVAEMTMQLCASNITEIDVDSQMLDSFEPGFFGRIVSSTFIDPSPLATGHVSTLIAKYFVLHQLDERLLEDILQKYDMEGLDCLNALKMLQIICTLECKGSTFFVNLRNHCTEILMKNWSDLRETFRSELFAIFLTLDTDTVTQIFDKIERRNYDKIHKTMTEQSKLLKNFESQLVDDKDDHEAEVTKVKRNMQHKFETIAAKKEDLEKELKNKDDAKAILASKQIPIVIGAVSSLSEDSNLKKVTQAWSIFSCSPEIPT
jgi:hypothetical protein